MSEATRKEMNFLGSKFMQKLYQFLGEDEELNNYLEQNKASYKAINNLIIFKYIHTKYRKDLLIKLLEEIRDTFTENDKSFIKNRENLYNWVLGSDGLAVDFLLILTNAVKKFLENESIEKYITFIKGETNDYFKFEEPRSIIPLFNRIIHNTTEKCRQLAERGVCIEG